MSWGQNEPLPCWSNTRERLFGSFPAQGWLLYPYIQEANVRRVNSLIESATEPEKNLYDSFVSPDPTSPTAPVLRPNHTFPESKQGPAFPKINPKKHLRGH